MERFMFWSAICQLAQPLTAIFQRDLSDDPDVEMG